MESAPVAIEREHFTLPHLFRAESARNGPNSARNAWTARTPCGIRSDSAQIRCDLALTLTKTP